MSGKNQAMKRNRSETIWDLFAEIDLLTAAVNFICESVSVIRNDHDSELYALHLRGSNLGVLPVWRISNNSGYKWTWVRDALHGFDPSTEEQAITTVLNVPAYKYRSALIHLLGVIRKRLEERIARAEKYISKTNMTIRACNEHMDLLSGLVDNKLIAPLRELSLTDRQADIVRATEGSANPERASSS